MENPYAPKRATFIYALLSFVIRLISAQASVFTLWYGRRCYERSRGEMITMLYEKTLSRKVVSISSKARSEENSDHATNGHGKQEEQSQWRKVLGYILYPIKTCCSRSKKSKDKKDLASMGKILNLMRNDAYEVAQRFWEFDKLITQPIGLVFSVVLVWRLIGWPCLLGVLTVFFAQIANAFIARVLLKNEAERRKATDVKLNKISQLVESIRSVVLVKGPVT
jgi:ABC-type multidrug transport system fused ATPase/permease subunit